MIRMFTRRAWTALMLVVGVGLILIATALAWFRPGPEATYRLARWVDGLFSRVISVGRLVSDPYRCRNRLLDPGVHLVVATHPSTIHTLALAAWLGVQARGRIVVVLREGLPLVPWVLRTTKNGVTFARGAFDPTVFGRNLRAAVDCFDPERNPVVVLLFPEGTRPDEEKIIKSWAEAARRYQDVFLEHLASIADRRTLVPRITGLNVMLSVLAPATITRLVWRVRSSGVELRNIDSWKPVIIRLDPADDLAESDGRLGCLYAHRAKANQYLSRPS